MEKYLVLGIILAVAVVATVILLFGIGKSSNLSINPPQQDYSAANSSLESAVYGDILGLQTYQNILPTGKSASYDVNYSLFTSSSLSNGSGSNSSELSRGGIRLYHGLNGNSEAFSNFTMSIPVSAGITYNITSLSYIFAVGNNTYLCTGSSSTAGKVSCLALNESMQNMTDALLSGLKMNRVSLLEAYNTTYRGYPCLFTVSSFDLALNESNSSLIAGSSGNEKLSGILTSCDYKKYNISVMSSLAADISVSIDLNGTSLNSNSYISYNEYILRLDNYTTDLTKNSLPS